MNQNEKSPQGTEQEKFWEAYRGCAEENRVAPDRSRYYVKWVKEFVDFLPGKRLKARTRKDIEAFLASVAKRAGIADWQVRQAEHALRMIYTHVLNRPGLSVKSPADL